MSKEKKEHAPVPEREHVQSCERHTYIIVGSITKGGHEKATHVRCAHCLKNVDLEQFESQEWREKNGF